MWVKASTNIIGLKESRLGNRGMGLIEVMIGVVLLAIAALVVSMLATQGHLATTAAGGSTECRERAEYMVNIFKLADNKATVNNWVQTTNAGTGTTIPAGGSYQHFERFANVPAINPTNLANISANGTAGKLSGMFNNWELVDSGTNWALSLFAATNGFCVAPTSPGLQIMNNQVYSGPTTLTYTASHNLIPPGNLLPAENEYLNIQLFDLKNNQVDAGAAACPTVGSPTGNAQNLYANPAIIPLGLDNSNGLNGPSEFSYTNSGLKVTSTITYNDQSGNPQQCAASAILRPDGDNAPPVFINSPTAVALGAGNYQCGNVLGPPVTGNLCIASTHAGPPIVNCAAAGITFYVATSEPGTAFLCQAYYNLNSAAVLPTAPNQANWLPCSAFLINGSGGPPPPNTVGNAITVNNPKNAGTVTDFSILFGPKAGGKIDTGFFELFVTAFDTAQNRSTTDAGVVVQEPASTYTAIVLSPPVPLIGLAGTVDAPSGHNAFSTVQAAAMIPAFGVDEFQCIQARPLASDYWEVTTTPPGGGAIYSINGTAEPNPSPGSGNCSMGGYSMAPLDPMADGNYSMQAQACNLCFPGGVGAKSAAFPWTLNTVAPSPAASPIGTTGENFVQGAIVPGWSLAQAEASPIPYEYACEYPTGSFKPATTTCGPATWAPSLFTPQPCTDQGSDGFCIEAFNGCGQTSATGPVNYQVLGKAGQSCGNVACDPTLICGLSPVTLGTCIASVACVHDADCGIPEGPTGHICFSGICDGVNAGPVSNAGAPGAPACPSLVTGCSSAAGGVCGVPPPPPSSPPPASPTPVPSPPACNIGTCGWTPTGACYCAFYNAGACAGSVPNCNGQVGSLQSSVPAAPGNCCCFEGQFLNGVSGANCP